jgi:hypothetical protein
VQKIAWSQKSISIRGHLRIGVKTLNMERFMKKIRLLTAIAGALFTLNVSPAPAKAQSARTFVSARGADTGACTLDSPCRTFAFAIGQTAAFGEIDVLDPADYGIMSIDRPISIFNDGPGVAGIQAGGGQTAIAINPGASVNLRGLTIFGLGGAQNGIIFGGNGLLTVTNCTIRFFQSCGICIEGVAAGGGTKFLISNTVVSTTTDGFGLAVDGSATNGGPTSIMGNIDRFWAINNTHGISITSDPASIVNVIISNSIASANRGDGIVVRDANVTILNSIMANNFNGLESDVSASAPKTRVSMRNSTATGNSNSGITNNGILVLSQSVVTSNLAGVAVGGTVNSYGDNDIDGNGTDVVGGTLTRLSPQ